MDHWSQLLTFNSSINAGVAFSTVNSLCNDRAPAKHAVDACLVPPCRKSGLKEEVSETKSATIRKNPRTTECHCIFLFLLPTDKAVCVGKQGEVRMKGNSNFGMLV